MKNLRKTRSFAHMNESEMNQLVRNSFVRITKAPPTL